MASDDEIYRRLIARVEMDAIEEKRPIPLI